jgi:flagella basal body P-ring formation protein FlgA
MLARLLLLLALLPAAFGAPGGAEAASLRQEARIEGPQVRLGDVFEGLPPRQAAVAIARAPELGREVTLDASWASRVARAYGVDYRPDSRYEQIVLIRSGHHIPAAEVEAEIAKLLRDRLPRGRVETEFDAPADLHVPVEMAPTVSVADFRFEAGSGRFTATVVAPADGEPFVRRTVTGRAEAMVEIPVLGGRVRPGTVIAADDVAWIEMASDRVPQDVAAGEDELVGMSPRRVLTPNNPVRLSDLQPPMVVGRGARVSMRVRYGALTVTATGRALEDGAMGEVIRVVNVDSSRTVEAVVTGPNEVAVDPRPAAVGTN